MYTYKKILLSLSGIHKSRLDALRHQLDVVAIDKEFLHASTQTDPLPSVVTSPSLVAGRKAETIRTEHQDRQEDLSAFDAYNEVVRKAEVMQSTMINEMGDAFRNRKVDTYAIRVRNVWGVGYISQVQIVCIPPHQLAVKP